MLGLDARLVGLAIDGLASRSRRLRSSARGSVTGWVVAILALLLVLAIGLALGVPREFLP